ncbi:MAG: HD domain-containing protein [Phycisphaerae bacterium]
MTESEAIWNQARTDLVIPTERGTADVFLWEHSVRVARYAGWIARLPEVETSSPDEMAVLAAALYHDAGWVVRLREEEIRHEEVFLRPQSESQIDQAARMLEQSLGKLLPHDSLARALRAIRAPKDRGSDSIEWHVVSDAENLDEFGIISVWLMVRRSVWEGKGIQAAIDTWRRKSEYRFWEARLQDSFQFAAVRELAEKRLAGFDRFMQDLANQHEGGDLEVMRASESPVPELGSPTK